MNNTTEKELEKAKEQFDAFDKNVKDLTLDQLNTAPKKEVEQQTKISSKELEKNPGTYLKPKRVLGTGVNPKTGEREKFNEKFRDDWNFAKEYVNFIAENNEVIGESIVMWTKPFPGTNCEEWEVPVNKSVWAPRYVAEQIKGRKYHRLIMQENRTIGSDGMGQYFGSMVADTTIQRLDAYPVSAQKSVFMNKAF